MGLIFLLLLFTPPAFSAPYQYNAEIIRITDGDTFVARIKIFPQLEAVYDIRILTIDAPELQGKCVEEKTRAKQAKAYLQTLLPIGSKVQLVMNDRFDSFGRALAHVHHSEYGNIASRLIAENYAVMSVKGKKNNWCD